MLRKRNRTIKNNLPGYLALSVFLLLLVIQLWSCSSVPRHSTLAFFFDGVPETSGHIEQNHSDAIKKSDSARANPTAAKTVADKNNYHRPYKEKQCGSCHDRDKMGKFVLPQPDLCYQCHNDYRRKYKVVHGPVGSGYCTQCHHNHSSKFEKLLTKSSRDLCLYCHNSDQVMKNKAHKEIADANCTKCHNPHGGANHALLK